jgi:hypothetical protein
MATGSGTGTPASGDVRSTMADLIASLRGMVNAGPSDYTINGQPYWTNTQLQEVLDRYRRDHYRAALTPTQTYSGGSVEWRHYYAGEEDLEATDGGTAIFYVQDAAGNNIGTAQYSMDYQRGHAEFGADTGGSVLFWYGRTFDLNRAAADVWRQKAAHYADRVTFQTDNHRVQLGDLQKQALAQAAYYEQRAESGGVIDLTRSDTDAY